VIDWKLLFDGVEMVFQLETFVIYILFGLAE